MRCVLSLRIWRCTKIDVYKRQLFSSPWAFEDALRRLKIDDGILLESAAAWRRQAENEHSLVNIALDEDPDLIKGRLMTAIDVYKRQV